MNHSMQRRLAQLILTGVPFTADDLTAEGQVTLDSTHTPNGRQNGIGSLFREAAAQGWITKTGRTAKSRAPHRKGGLILEWQGTEKGRRWARQVLDAVPR